MISSICNSTAYVKTNMFDKTLIYISENNINPDDIFLLVEKVKNSNLKDEKTVRAIIKEASVLAKKEIDPLKEDALVKRIINDGISEDLLNLI